MKSVSLATATAVFTGRAVRRTVRTPEVIIQTVIFPIVLFLTMLAVFSTAVEAFGSDEVYAQRLVPGLLVAGLMFGSTGSATGLFSDIHSGFMTRLRSMATPPTAPVMGITLAEVARSLVAVVALTAVGAIAGFRFQGGAASIIGFCAVAALAALTFPWVGLWLATKAKTLESFLPLVTAVFLVLLFMSRSMVPLEAYPDIAQPVVEWNPGSAFVVLLDGLARGTATAADFMHAAAWSVGIIGVFGTLATRGIAKHQ